MNPILYRQLAQDYCCSPEDAADGRNHFCFYRPLEGRRLFQAGEDCYLKVAVVNGKLLFTGQEEILRWCEEQYRDEGGAWFLEPKNLRRLDERFLADGCRIETAHPFFLPEEPTAPPKLPADVSLRWYEEQEIEAFRGDKRFDEAFVFDPQAQDRLGLAAILDGEILSMAGASSDCARMWQIGVNTEPAARGLGLGTALVCRLKDELLRRGILPFYGTSPSHLASQRLALRAGFRPAWLELVTSR